MEATPATPATGAVIDDAPWAREVKLPQGAVALGQVINRFSAPPALGRAEAEFVPAETVAALAPSTQEAMTVAGPRPLPAMEVAGRQEAAEAPLPEVAQVNTTERPGGLGAPDLVARPGQEVTGQKSRTPEPGKPGVAKEDSALDQALPKSSKTPESLRMSSASKTEATLPSPATPGQLKAENSAIDDGQRVNKQTSSGYQDSHQSSPPKPESEGEEVSTGATSGRDSFHAMRQTFGETRRNWKKPVERARSSRSNTSVANTPVAAAAGERSVVEAVRRLEGMVNSEMAGRQVMQSTMEHEVRRQVQALKVDYERRIGDIERRFRDFFSR